LKGKIISRRRLLKGAALLGTAGTIGAVVTLAKSYSALAASSKVESDDPLGAWFITLTPNLPPGVKPPPPDAALTVFNSGGSVVETDRQYLKASPGMGSWVKTGKYTFEYTLLKQSVNPDNTYARAEHINHKVVLNETFDKFSGKYESNRLGCVGKSGRPFYCKHRGHPNQSRSRHISGVKSVLVQNSELS